MISCSVARAARLASLVVFSFAVACGGGKTTGVTPPTGTPTVTVSTAASAVTASSTAPGTVGISIARAGGFVGAVTLSAENLPAGVTAAFGAATLASSVTSSTLTLTVGATAVAGVTPLTIRASGSGVTSSTVVVQLTVVVPSINLTAASATITSPQGASANVALTLERLGGFTAAVNVVVEGLPANVAASFAPAAFATGVTASTLTIAVAASAAAGTTAITVRATGAGVADRTVVLQLTVQNAPLIPLSLTFCDLSRIPVFFAVRDGTSGAWRAVAPTGNTYSWTFAGNIGSFVLVWQSPLNRLFTVFETYMSMYSGTSAEIAQGVASECFLQPVRGKSLTGTIAPAVGALELAFVSAGWGNALLNPGGAAFSLPDVAPGGIDLIATRFAFNAGANGYQPSQFILRRGVNLTSGAPIPLLDFNGSEAFAPATATISIGNLNGERAAVRSAFNPVNSAQLVIDNGILTTSTTHTHFGVPDARMLTGELQEVMVTAFDASNTTYRQVVRFARAPISQTLVLGAPPASPAVTVTNGAVSRPRVRGTLQSDYNKSVNVLFTQSVARKQAWLQVSPGFLNAASTYDLEVPDLSAVPGFNAAWGLTVGSPTAYNLYMSNALAPFANGFPGTFSLDGATFLFSQRSGNVP